MKNETVLNEYLEEFFLLGEHLEPRKWKALRVKLKIHTSMYGDTPQVNEILTLMDMYEDEYYKKDFESSRSIVKSILIRLNSTENWSFFDIRILAQVVAYAKTYKHVHAVAEKALQALAQYQNEKGYMDTKLLIHYHVAHRLLRTRYYNIEPIDKYEMDALGKLFDDYANQTLAICRKNNFPLFERIMLIRKGLFEKNYDLIDENLRSLKNNERKAIWMPIQDEVCEFNTHAGNAISAEQFNVMVGRNIRRIRQFRGIRTDDFAKMVGVTVPYINLIERGERGTLTHKMYKIANILNVKCDLFFQNTDIEKVLSAELSPERQRV